MRLLVSEDGTVLEASGDTHAFVGYKVNAKMESVLFVDKRSLSADQVAQELQSVETCEGGRNGDGCVGRKVGTAGVVDSFFLMVVV
jgi:hypothetical protein